MENLEIINTRFREEVAHGQAAQVGLGKRYRNAQLFLF
jgi:hypothetical protein